jgi:hypothetical protein
MFAPSGIAIASCLICFLSAAITVFLFNHIKQKTPSPYYQIAVGGRLWDNILQSRACCEKAKERSKLMPGTPIEIWMFERLGYARVSVSAPYHWKVGQTGRCALAGHHNS